MNRKLGFEVNLNGKLLSELEPEEFYRVINSLWDNGVICIKNQEKLTLDDYVGVANRIGQAIRLPPELAFNNREPDYPEIARVGNLAPDGTVKTQYTVNIGMQMVIFGLHRRILLLTGFCRRLFLRLEDKLHSWI